MEYVSGTYYLSCYEHTESGVLQERRLRREQMRFWITHPCPVRPMLRLLVIVLIQPCNVQSIVGILLLIIPPLLPVSIRNLTSCLISGPLPC